MTLYRRNDRVQMRVQADTWLPARILSEIVATDAAEAWVCPETEWHTARQERRHPDGLPWATTNLRHDPNASA